jgi:translation initiation factor 1
MGGCCRAKTDLMSMKSAQNLSSLASLSGLVYSTDSGRMCPDCRQPKTGCICKAAAPAPAGDGIVRVSRETKGRGGKAVTVIKGLALDAAALTPVAKQLKTACGSGGTVKDGVVEVQGDHVDKIMATLKALGHTVKRTGG